MDNTSSGLWIYPSCGYNNILQSGDITTIFNNGNLIPRDAVSGGNRSNLHQWSNQTYSINLWPIEIEIVNDYRLNQVYVLFHNGQRSISCLFDDVFTANTDTYLTIRSDTNRDEGIEIYNIVLSKDDGEISAANNDPLVEITTSTSTVIDTSTPLWLLNNTIHTDPPDWYVLASYIAFFFYIFLILLYT